MSDIQEIQAFSTSFEARLAAAHLKSVGIDARILTDNAGGAIPSLTGLSGGARLVVRTQDVEDALAALGEFDPGDGVEDS